MPRVTTLCLIVLIGMLSFASAESFKDFMNEQETEFSGKSEDFDEYKNGVIQEFEAYKRVIHEEYDKFRNELVKFWEEPEIGDRKKWVEYSKDLQTRKTVDFENNIIEVDIIVPSKKTDPEHKNVDEKINTILKDLLLEDEKAAVERDQLNENIRKRIKAEHISVKSGHVENRPILTAAITGKSNPSQQHVEQTVSDLRKSETIAEKPSKVKNKDVVKVTIPLPADFPVKKAMEFKSDVNQYARSLNIDEALVLAVMHTESAFNPMARSPVPAYGLMQVVPQSAGLDATKLIYGKQKLLSSTYLYNAKNNINVGTAYIHILYYRYLKNIKNPESRLFCTIAAYNTGAGNVAKAFTGSTNIGKAVYKINSMPPDKVYDHLQRRLPYAETRHYLKNVSNRMNVYKNMN